MTNKMSQLELDNLFIINLRLFHLCVEVGKNGRETKDLVKAQSLLTKVYLENTDEKERFRRLAND